jgi:hypothetical protein
MAKAPSLSDISKEVCKSISGKSEQRFTGKLTVVCEINMSNGGITDAFIDKETERTRVRGSQ